MSQRLLSPLLGVLFWSALFVVVTGGFDYQGSIGGFDFRLDLTSPDQLVLLFLLLLGLWHLTGGSLAEIRCLGTWSAAYDSLRDATNRRWILATVGFLGLVFFVAPLVRHSTFHTGYDLAIFGQAYWNTLQGDFLYSSIRGMVLWGDHLNPIVLGILPFYRLWPTPETLLILQSLALMAGALPVYLLARRELSHQGVAMVLALAYLVYQPVRLMNLFDFHPIVFATPLILTAVYQLRRGAWGWFLICCLLVGSTKETGPIAVALLGLACVFLSPRRRLGVAVTAVGVAWFVLNLTVIMPAFNPTGVDVQLDRYDYLGGSPSEILTTLVTRPVYVLSHNLTSRELFYPVRVLAPLAFLPLLTPVGLLVVPYLAINILEGTGVQVWLIHYQAELTAFVFVAAVFGAGRVMQVRPARFVAAAVTAGALLFFGTSDVYHLRQGWPTDETRRIHQTLELIPPVARVSAQAALSPHLTQRRVLEIFPEKTSSDWVVVDSGLDPWPVPPERYRRTVRRLKRVGFQPQIERGQTVVFSRDPEMPVTWQKRSERTP